MTKDVVVSSATDDRAAIQLLSTLGYGAPGQSRGGREGSLYRSALDAPLTTCPSVRASASRSGTTWPYATLSERIRTFGREHGALKKRLALELRNDIDGYVDGKTDAILRILRMSGFQPEELQTIERINHAGGLKGFRMKTILGPKNIEHVNAADDPTRDMKEKP